MTLHSYWTTELTNLRLITTTVNIHEAKAHLSCLLVC